MGGYEIRSMIHRGVRCPFCGVVLINTTERPGGRCKCGGRYMRYEEVSVERIPVCNCGREARERYSLGVYAGLFCDECWRHAGYRDEGPEGFDPLDAGEAYEPEPEVG